MCKRLLAFMVMLSFSLAFAQQAGDPNEKITLTRGQLEMIITKAVDKAVTEAVAIAVKEKELEIIELKKQLEIKDLQIDNLKTVNTSLGLQVSTAEQRIEKLQNEKMFIGIGTGVGGTALGFGIGYLIYGLK